MTYPQFLDDHKTQDAVVRNIAGTRDRLIHEYFGVNWSILWDVVKNKLPELKRQLERASQ